jgi:hypothetical protein
VANECPSVGVTPGWPVAIALFRNIPKCYVSIIRRGGGKFHCPNAKQAAYAGLPQIDTPHILHPDFIRVLVDDAVFTAHASVGDRVFAPDAIQLNPGHEDNSESEKCRPYDPENAV